MIVMYAWRYYITSHGVKLARTRTMKGSRLWGYDSRREAEQAQRSTRLQQLRQEHDRCLSEMIKEDKRCNPK